MCVYVHVCACVSIIGRREKLVDDESETEMRRDVKMMLGVTVRS